MAIVVDLGVHLVKATYNLEGDGPLILEYYQNLQSVSTAIGHKQDPNFEGVLRNLEADQHEATQARAHVLAGIQDAMQFFLRKFNVQHVDVVRAFKAARLLSPYFASASRPGPEAVELLRMFPFLDEDACVADLHTELPAYLAAADGVHAHTDTLSWWGKH